MSAATISTRSRPARNDVNLAHILVGSEGTLGFSTKIELKLSPLLGRRAVGACHFGSFQSAMEAAQHIVKLAPIAVELIDRTMLGLARDIAMFQPTINAVVRGEPEAILFVEFGEDDHRENFRRLLRLSELMGDLGYDWGSTGARWGGVIEVMDAALQTAIGEVRAAGLNVMMSMKDEGKPVSFVEDCAVPLEHLAEYTAKLTEVFERHGTRGTWYAHASVGCLHVRPILNLRLEKDVKAMRAIAEEAFAMVRDYKGSHSGEHGDGIVRSEFHAVMFGERLVNAFEDVKDRFDPNGAFNPGKIVRAPKFDDRNLFRYGPDYHADALTTHLDWSAYPGQGGGFQGAVEMCNNNGACRALKGGVMCPSYRVTRDERDVTRGRANTLRLAITGQLGPDALASDEMAETLKYCVSCKACRRECPTGVDMARMKIEVQAARLEKARAVAARPAGRLPAALRAVGGAVSRARQSARQDADADADVGEARRLQRAAQAPGVAQGRGSRMTAARRKGDGAEVVLFADTFNRYFEPENLRAAVAVLEAAGCRVHLPTPVDRSQRPLCCGRTFLSVGLVEQARAEAERTLAALEPYVGRGVRGGRARAELHPRLPRRDPGLAEDRGSALAGGARHAVRGIRDARARRARCRWRRSVRARCCTAIATRNPSALMGPVETALKLVPGLAVETIEFELLRHGRRLRLRRRHHRRVAQDGRAVAAAGGAQRAGRRDHRRRRHLLPPPDRRRRRPRGAACRARAGDERRGRAQSLNRTPA